MSAPTEPQPGPTPDPSPPDKRLRYVVVGLGEIALREVIPALVQCKKSRLMGFVSGHPEKAANYAADYGLDPKNIYNYQNYDQLRGNSEVDAVYIALPNSMHAEYTVRAAQAGKHVLCEKPMANSVQECEQMIDACKKANRKLMIAYRQQYDPFNRAVVKIARSGELGRMRAFSAINGQNQGDPTQWRQHRKMSGGGSLVDVGIYCFNASRFISGEEPIEVSARTETDHSDPRFPDVEDRITFALRYPSGWIANMMSAYSLHDTKNYQVMFEKGHVDLNPAFHYRGQRLFVSHVVNGPEVVEERRLEEKNQFALEIDHFSTAVMEDKQPHTPGEEGLQDRRIIEACYQSVDSGRPVSLPRHDGLDVFRGMPVED